MKITINTDKVGFYEAKEAVHMTLAAMSEGYSEYEGIYRDRYISFWIEHSNKPKELHIEPQTFNAVKSESFDRNASHMAGEYVSYKDNI